MSNADLRLTQDELSEINQEIKRTMASIDDQNSIAYYGPPLNDKTKELIKNSLEKALTAAIIAEKTTAKE